MNRAGIKRVDLILLKPFGDAHRYVAHINDQRTTVGIKAEEKARPQQRTTLSNA